MSGVLVACEESQTVTIALRKHGLDAFSCDVEECSGGHPEWHLREDVVPLLDRGWDMIIAHPPCTYLTVTGNRWFNVDRYGDSARERLQLRERAIEFFLKIANASCARIAIENPVGVISSRWRKPDQIVQPYWFGDPFEKKTCLWLKGLPKLVPTRMVAPEPRAVYKSGCSMPPWYANAKHADRSRIRSKTFQGFADCMAEQWGALLAERPQLNLF